MFTPDVSVKFPRADQESDLRDVAFQLPVAVVNSSSRPDLSGALPHTGRVTVVTEPQSWVLIGIFATIMLGGLTLSTNLIMRTVTASISGIEGRLSGRIDGLEGRIGGLDGRIDGLEGRISGLDTKIESLRGEMNARFDAMGTRIDHLDRDVAALSRRVWGEPSGE